MLSSSLLEPQIVAYTGTKADWCSVNLCGRLFRVPAVLVDSKPVCPKCAKVKGYAPNTKPSVPDKCDRPKPQTKAPKERKSPSKAHKPKSPKSALHPVCAPSARQKTKPKPAESSPEYLEPIKALLADGPRHAKDLAQELELSTLQFYWRALYLVKTNHICRAKGKRRNLIFYALPQHYEQLQEIVRSLVPVKKRPARVDRRGQILGFLRDAPRTTHEIAAFLGIEYENARVILFKMRRKGMVISRASIRRNAPCTWALPSHQALLDSYVETSVEDEILAWIAQNPRRSVTKICAALAKKLQMSRDTIRKKLYKLVREGKVIRGKGNREERKVHYLPELLHQPNLETKAS